jgi:hypothetical protein
LAKKSVEDVRPAKAIGKTDSPEKEETRGSAEGRRVANALKRAIPPCDLRNLLAHGTWWELNPDKPAMKVRREKLRTGHKRHVTVKVEKIDDEANELRNIEAELFRFRGPIEERLLTKRRRQIGLSAWIERHIVLPDVVAEPGRIVLAPYMRAIADAIGDPALSGRRC